jgi:Family of unknown function (DUF6289)
MKKKAGLIALVLTLVFALFALGAMMPVASGKAAGNCTYYSDASHTKVVGQYGYDCCNNRIAWGTKTQYAECGGCFVCHPPPR